MGATSLYIPSLNAATLNAATKTTNLDVGSSHPYLKNDKITTTKLGETICHIKDGQIFLMEHANGDKEWYFNGELHRTDGPTIERTNGDKEWYFNGERFADGPLYSKLID